jgi:hypothetical protein
MQTTPETEGIKLKGWINFRHERGGKVIREFDTPNLVVSAGKAGVASRINGDGGLAAFTYIALGTGATAANAADTALQTESSGSGADRASATASRVTTTVTNDTAQLAKTFSLTGSFAFTESGVFNAASGVTLLCRQTFSAINVISGDSLTVTWKIACS